MPGVITHYLMGHTCLKQMSLRKINCAVAENKRSAFDLGTQGPDFLFYDALDRQMGLLGERMHMSGIASFYRSVFEYIKSRVSAEEKETLIAYMLGFLCHYTMDYTAHPFIYYLTGFSDETGRLGRDTKQAHRFLETTIDCVLAKSMANKRPYKMEISRKLELASRERQWIGEMYAKTVAQTYSILNKATDYGRAMSQMAFFYNLFNDRSGRRKAIVAALGKLLGDQGATAALIHDDSRSEAMDYLNLSHQPWRYPWDDSITVTFSFLDLFDMAIEDSLIYVSAFLKTMGGKMAPDVAVRILGNKNFSTGLESYVKFLYDNRKFVKKRG